MMQVSAHRRALTWALAFACWTLVGLSYAVQVYLASREFGVQVTWWRTVFDTLGKWYVFALLSLPVLYLARRFRLEGRLWAPHALLHVLCGILFSLANMVLRGWIKLLQGWIEGSPVSFAGEFQVSLVTTWHFNLLIYWVIVCVSHAFEYYRRYQERRLRAAELERRLSEARLRALQMQLNPHFLFNTLHSISALMHQDVEAADRMMAQLSDLLRHTLESSDAQTVSLREELAFLERYLAIEQVRFGDRLEVKVNVPGELLDAQVPNLILQPLVENALRHGIEPSLQQGRLELTAERSDGGLTLTVCDNGAGLPGNGTRREGVGLANTRARLGQLYGQAAELTLGNQPGGGVRAQVRLPLHLKDEGS
jgi:two-component system, LytTR family, sensor kinase